MPLPPPEECARIEAELDRLSLEEIKARLAHGVWRGEKREYVELYADRKEREKYERLSTKDRNIQLRIRALALGAFIATLVGWFLL